MKHAQLKQNKHPLSQIDNPETQWQAVHMTMRPSVVLSLNQSTIFLL